MPRKASSRSKGTTKRAKAQSAEAPLDSTKHAPVEDSDSPYREDTPISGAPSIAAPVPAPVPNRLGGGESKSKTGKTSSASPQRGRAPKASVVVDAASVLNAFRPPAFSAVLLDEPAMIFGDGQKGTDPKTGLALYKPFDIRTSGRRDKIRLGIIGTGSMIDATHAWIDRCKGRVAPTAWRRGDHGALEARTVDPIASPPFPGFMEVFECEFSVGENMVATLTEPEITSVLQLEYFEQRVTRLVSLVTARLGVLAQGMQAPDVVIVALPTEVRKACTVPSNNKTRAKRAPTLADALKASLAREKVQGQGSLFDVAALHHVDLEAMARAEQEEAAEQAVFRHGLKARAMAHGVPIQLAWQVTLQGGPTVEDDATRAWNFWTGVYYKAGGIPWRVSGLERGSCYVGIAFYKDRNDGTLRTSMAQAFSDQGEGVVLRSEPFKWSPTQGSKSPHMPRELAAELMRRVVASYEEWHHQPPSRVVVHKWQRYFDDERTGFEESLRTAGIHSFDLLAFGNRGIRFFRPGMEPPVRGTMVTLAPRNVLLYTRGFVPYLGVYPGMRVPRPIEIVEHHGSSSLRKLSEEILALTKMDWNSAIYAGKDPITTAFSEDVGQILAEMPAGEVPRPVYRFYM